MTFTAREVLRDCQVALDLLESEQDLQRWRVHWAGALALIRAVGHVLHKVDGSERPIGDLVKASFESWKQDRQKHAVFWEFIEAERNNVLKQYQFNTHPLDEVDVAVVMTVQHPDTGEIRHVPEIVPLGSNIYRPIVEGYGMGDDARDIYREAIDWWEAQLTAIESKVSG